MADFVKDIHVLLSRTHNQCLDQLKHLRFDPDVNSHLMIVSLYCSLVEYAGTILVLTEQGRRTGFSSVFRSFIEGYVDLRNLIASEDFYHRKEASFHDEWRKVLEKVGTDNPYLKGIAESEKLDERLKWHKDTLAELAAAGHTPVSVYDSFAMAGRELEYNSLYRFECAEAHNDFRALLKRNVKMDAQGKATVEAYLVPPSDYYLARLDTTVDFLLEVSEDIHARIESEAKAHFTALKVELAKVRTAYSETAAKA